PHHKGEVDHEQHGREAHTKAAAGGLTIIDVRHRPRLDAFLVNARKSGVVPEGSTPLSQRDRRSYLMMLVTVPAPTVRPPSRIAKPRPASIAMGWMSSTVMSVVSPGITISVPSGSEMTPVTSVVRK